jgi:hypothetical protein
MPPAQLRVGGLFLVSSQMSGSLREDARLASMGAYYIAISLDMRARFDLSVLDSEFQKAGLHGGVSLRDGIWCAGYSTTEHCCRNPADSIDHMLRIVESLGSDARNLWDGCYSRRFDLGYCCFDTRYAYKWQVNSKLMRRLAQVNGDLVVTIYPSDPDDDYMKIPRPL